MDQVLREVTALQSGIIYAAKFADKWALHIYSDILEKLGKPDQPTSSTGIRRDLSKFPAQSLMYAGGIAAVESDGWEAFKLLVVTSEANYLDDVVPAYIALSNMNVVGDVPLEICPGAHYQSSVHKGSDYLAGLLKEPISETLAASEDFEHYFDYFEYVSSLLQKDYQETNGHGVVTLGRFADPFDWQNSELREHVSTGVEKYGESWGPLSVGLLGGRVERFKRAQEGIDKMVQNQ